MPAEATPCHIRTERLQLRPYRLEDAPAMLEIFSDPEVTRFLGAGRPIESLEHMVERIERTVEHQRVHGFSLWIVEDAATGEILGDCGLKMLDGGPDIEIGYRFRRSAWGKGYATEAARACMAYGHEHLGIRRIVAVVQPANIPSQRIARKLGLIAAGPARYYQSDCIYFSPDGSMPERSETSTQS
ncbi:MAG TPA: GNAT family N-acetyltransferase [Candidatus Kapabacteria bacterium]|nr:GNAT family N-acetyltransferase [Candidatus Kapabacteria bacterium]